MLNWFYDKYVFIRGDARAMKSSLPLNLKCDTPKMQNYLLKKLVATTLKAFLIVLSFSCQYVEGFCLLCIWLLVKRSLDIFVSYSSSSCTGLTKGHLFGTFSGSICDLSNQIFHKNPYFKEKVKLVPLLVFNSLSRVYFEFFFFQEFREESFNQEVSLDASRGVIKSNSDNLNPS